MEEKKSQDATSQQLAKTIAAGMLEKKGVDIVMLDMRHIKNSIADFFVICSGNSDTQVDALKTSVDETVYKALKENPWRVEGSTNKEWVLIDYANVVAHIFTKEKRGFYGLEELWGDAKVIEVNEEVTLSN